MDTQGSDRDFERDYAHAVNLDYQISTFESMVVGVIR